MTELPETTDIYKHVMNAPSSEPLTLSLPMLALLRDWLHGEVVVLAKLSNHIANLEAVITHMEAEEES